MAADQGPVVQSALLRSELVRLRKERGLTQQQVARELEWSASKLIRVEGGASSITKVDLDALLSEYGVTSESHRERLQSLNRAAKERGWWDSYRDYVSPAYLHYVGLEAGAAFIRQFQIGFIPGLLQTPEYARVVTEVGSVDPQKVGPIVELRLRRRSELAQREAKPRQYFVIDEAVIHRHVGIKKDRAIMPNQLRSIAERADRDRSGYGPGDSFRVWCASRALRLVHSAGVRRRAATRRALSRGSSGGVQHYRWTMIPRLRSTRRISRNCLRMPCPRRGQSSSSGTWQRRCPSMIVLRSRRHAHLRLVTRSPLVK